jgi:hypothetical protein
MELDTVPCRHGNDSSDCPGRVEVVRLAEGDQLIWSCTVCGESGSLSNWRSTKWDAVPEVMAARRSIGHVGYLWGMLDADVAAGIEDDGLVAWSEVDEIDVDGPPRMAWEGSDLPTELAEVLNDPALMLLDGVHGDPWVGDPVEYEMLEVAFSRDVLVAITVRNRGIAIMGEPTEEMLRVHRIMSVARRLATDGDGSE